jgi:branched-chain amino acid transport system permease protein
VSVGLLLQVLVTGLAAGTAVGLVAVGITLLYRMTGLVQLAHGHILGVALLASLGAAGALRTGVATVPSWRLLLAALAALGTGAGGSAIVANATTRTTRTADPGRELGVLVATVLALEALLLLGVRREGYVFPDLLPGAAKQLALPDGAAVAGRSLWALVLGAAGVVVAERLLRSTRSGRAVAAVADDAAAARAIGLPVDRLVTIAFIVTGALAAGAGLLVAPGAALTPHTGVILGVRALAAALVVGFSSLRRAFLASLLLGLASAALVSLDVPGLGRPLGPGWAEIAPLLIALAVLALRPPVIALERIE